ncbi:uncharacterized protein [Ptychodera flava]|uniref:uncharacterized protein n=1 Tax=Ptychodera flava TaxID=63121 RepID=UPI003969D7B7
MSSSSDIKYLTDLSISETSDFKYIEIKAQCPGLTMWRELTGAVKVEAKFEDNSFDVKVNYNSNKYAFEANGKPLFKPIMKNKCSYKVRENRIEISLRKEEPVTWRAGGDAVQILAE